MRKIIVFNKIIYIGVLGKIMPDEMLITQQEDMEIGNAMRYVKLSKKPISTEMLIKTCQEIPPAV